MTSSRSSSCRPHRVRRALLATALSLFAGLTYADAYPDKPIKLIVPYPPGGSADTVARILGQKLGERLKQPVLIENKPGVSGSIASIAVAKSAPDGYTLMSLATPNLLAPLLFKTATYDIERDFTPIATLYDLPLVMVVNPTSLPEVMDVPKLVALAKGKAGQMSYGSSGAGTFGHLSMEALKTLGGFDMQHIPYRGAAPAITDLIGGQFPVMYGDLGTTLPHIQSGKLRAIAVGSPQRLSVLPNVRTMVEQGFPNFEAVSWGGLVGPPGMSKEIVTRLTREIKEIMAEPDVHKRLATFGTLPAYQGPDELAERIRRDYQKWGKVIKDNGVTVDN